jgi:hypothetical protein
MRNLSKWPLAALLVAATAGTAMAQSLSNVTVTPTSVEGGKRAILTVQLDSAAPKGGVTVTLASSDTTVAKLPASVTVERRRTEADVVVDTQEVSVSTPVTLTATLGNTNMTATLTVAPLQLMSVAVDPSTVVGGQDALGWVVLNGPAPSGGFVITLVGDNSVATLPTTVTVPEGYTRLHFPVPTTVVTVNQTVNVTATDPNDVVQNTSFTVVPLELGSFTLSQSSVKGGNSVRGDVVLNGEAPSGGVVVTLSSNNAAATVPATVTIPAGYMRAHFEVTTTAVTVVTPVILSAEDPSGTTLTANLTVNPVQVALIDVAPDSVKGGKTVGGVVMLDGAAPTGGLVITLTSNSLDAIPPPTVTVAAGKRTVTFSVTTTAVTSRTVVTLTATDPSGKAVTVKLVLRV